MTSIPTDDAPLVVTICQGGLVRSGGLKYALTYRYKAGFDVLALGIEGNSVRRLRALTEQATHVVVMQAVLLDHLPDDIKHSGKVLLCEVGPDRYGSPLHPQLQLRIDNWVSAGGAVRLGVLPPDNGAPSNSVGPTKPVKRPNPRVPRARRNAGDGQP